MSPLPTLLRHQATPLQASNSTTDTLQVICAWPVSGQYGAGERVLYYVLVATCITARKENWVKKACLGLVLLFPAVAALHGIVLAAVHQDGAVDLDVYGALQLCSIGALAAPVTVTLSSTYFNEPGRNAIFGWSGIVLAGLLSLTIEFYRATPSSCTQDELGGPISANPEKFPYGSTQCGMICSVSDGPYSPIRGGSGNNIDVVPAPSVLTFNAATLVAAACCIPAILLLIYTVIRIFDTKSSDDSADEVVTGPGTPRSTGGANDNVGHTPTGSAEPQQPKKSKGKIGRLQRIVMIPVFGAAILAIVVVGERNLFSTQINYDTEPMANVGQWGPIAGVAFALLGSFYLLLADAVNDELKSRSLVVAKSTLHSSLDHPPDLSHDPLEDYIHHIEQLDTSHNQESSSLKARSRAEAHPQAPFDSCERPGKPFESLLSRLRNAPSSSRNASSDKHASILRLLAKWIVDFGEALGLNKTPDKAEAPQSTLLAIPGEKHRNPQYHQTVEWNQRQSTGGSGESIRPRSRAESYAGSVASSVGIHVNSPVVTEAPLQRQQTLEIPTETYGRRQRPRVPSIVLS